MMLSLESPAACKCKTNFGMQANRVDPDQTAPIGVVWIHTICYRHLNRTSRYVVMIYTRALTRILKTRVSDPTLHAENHTKKLPPSIYTIP